MSLATFPMIAIQASLIALTVGAVLHAWWEWHYWWVASAVLWFLSYALYALLLDGNKYALFGALGIAAILCIAACIPSWPSNRTFWISDRFHVDPRVAVLIVVLPLAGHGLLLWTAWGGTPKALYAVNLITLWFCLQVWAWSATKSSDLVQNYGNDAPVPGADTLLVVIHGAGGPAELASVYDNLGELDADWGQLDPTPGATNDAAKHKSDVLKLAYGAYPHIYASNTDPFDIAAAISTAIQKKDDEVKYKRIVIVGYSMGALLCRKAFVIGRGAVANERKATPGAWVDKVQRIVLLAGMNRGWNISGPRPADMTANVYWRLWLGAWLGEIAGVGNFPAQMRKGSPFVANLRMQWLTTFRDSNRKAKLPRTVQLLGDIDDLVSDDDNKDMHLADASNFVFMRVRGTGHPDICKLGPVSDTCDDDASLDNEDKRLACYRRKKVVEALTLPFGTLVAKNEKLPDEQDAAVQKVVFVLHGIRDLGRWSADFETEFVKQSDGGAPKLQIVSPRYGYFGMGPFLMAMDRQKYVRWFMDEYTETVARYPSVRPDTDIHFIGHSNGTYVLGSALEQYAELRVNRIVFGGSVLPKAYEWDKRQSQVQMVCNFTATDDWVVALFPRFFELPVIDWLGNDIGSAGFNGFDAATLPQDKAHPKVVDVGPISGQHAAFLSPPHVKEIATYILSSDGKSPTPKQDPAWPKLHWWSDWGTPVVWLLLAGVIIGLGFFLIRGAQPYAGYVAIVYALVVWWLLKTI